MKRKWVIWGVVALVLVIAVLVIAQRQRSQRTVKYLGNLSSDNYQDAADAMDGLASRGGSVLPELLTRLGDQTDPRLRWRAAEVLGRIGDPSSVDPLIAAVKDNDAGVRQMAVGALGKIADPKAAQPLIAALEDEEPAVQVRAALALGIAGDPSAVAPLGQLFQRSMPEVVAKAEAAKAKAKALEEGKSAPAEPPKPVGPPPPPPDTRFQVREAVIRALGQLTEKSPEALAAVDAALDDPHEAVRAAACETLGQLHGKDSVPRLAARIDDVSATVSIAATVALARIDDPASTDALKRAATPDREYWVRQAAEEALQRRGIRAQ